MSILTITAHDASIFVTNAESNAEPRPDQSFSTEASKENRHNLKSIKRTVLQDAHSENAERAAVIAADALRRKSADRRVLSWIKKTVTNEYPVGKGPLNRSIRNAYVEAARGMQEVRSSDINKIQRAGEYARFIYALGRTEAHVVVNDGRRHVELTFGSSNNGQSRQTPINAKVAKRLEKVLTEESTRTMRFTFDFSGCYIEHDAATILTRVLQTAANRGILKRFNFRNATYQNDRTRALLAECRDQIRNNAAPAPAMIEPA
jgi:hypothetical protein